MSDYFFQNDKTFTEKLTKDEITKPDIIEVLTSAIDDIPEKVVAAGAQHIFEIIKDNIVSGNRIEIRGFGSWSIRYLPPRNTHNPRNGEKIMTSGKFKPHFKTSLNLKEKVNNKQVFYTISEKQLEEG